MTDLRPAGDSGPSFRGIPHPGIAAGLPARAPTGALLTHAELLLRRLRYYRDLLVTGYRQALDPTPLTSSLRAERIALGIDRPELDAVPVWSARGRAGTVAIPFIEFILGQIETILAELSIDPGFLDPQAEQELAGARRSIGRVLEQASGGGEAVTSQPRLCDVFVAAGLVQDLCGHGGCLDTIVRRCDTVLHGEGRS